MMEQARVKEGDVERHLHLIGTICDAMTAAERAAPDDLGPAERRRIAERAGVGVAEVDGFIRNYERSRDMMRAAADVRAGAGDLPGAVLGLVTDDPTRRDPSFVHSPAPWWRGAAWLTAAVIAAALLALAWGRYGR